ncbi:Dynein_heavy chain [Hexamita inflata]|uniref:Dynein heavy chain n=1 Tax=Hexamita inflata TaxID=28002 RepID=A0AA86UTJ9_9EUKA|nr:Dynein heavy chain [Hexamita inflata]
MLPKPLKKNQVQLSEFQHHYLKNMAEPPLQTGSVSQQVRQVALERRKHLLATQPVMEVLNNFTAQLIQDDEKCQQFDRARLQLSDFDDETICTRSLQEWIKQARSFQLGKETVRGIYCQAFDGSQWQEGIVTGLKDRHAVVQSEDFVRLYPSLFVFVYGEDIEAYNSRLQNAIYQRNQTESYQRFTNYVNCMPTEANSKYPPTLREEIKNDSIPFFKAHYVLNFSNETYNQLKKKTLQNLDSLIEKSSHNFLKSQNRVIFEQAMEKSPSIVAERGLELARDYIVDQKLVLFYNQQKNDNVYRYLITPSTLLSFVPQNCQFDDFGNPIVELQELQLNVGIYLLKHFEESREALQYTYLNEYSIMEKINDFNQKCQTLIGYQLRKELLERHSLASSYNRAFLYDEIKYNNLMFVIIQKQFVPQMAILAQVYSIDDFKTLQFQHQQQMKKYLEDTFLQEVKQIITAQLLSASREFGLGALTMDEYTKQPKLIAYLKRINLQIRDTLIYFVQNSFAMFSEMFEKSSKWTVECKSTKKVQNIHEDNVFIRTTDTENKKQTETLTVYRPPIFAIDTAVKDQIATMEEKSFIDKLHSNYIFGLPPLFVNERVKIDEEDQDNVPDEQEMVEDDELNQLQIETQLDSNLKNVQMLQKQNKDDITSGMEIRQFVYVTNPNDFKKMVLDVFQNSLTCIQSITKIEHLVTRVTYPDREYHKIEQNELYEETKLKIGDSMDHIITPLIDYVQTFSAYRELLFMDEEKYLSTINYRAEMYLTGLTLPKNIEVPTDIQRAIESAEPLSPNDLKSLVKQKQDQADDIMFDIPEIVHVGCFLVKNEEIRKYLNNKCLRLAEGIQKIITLIATKKAQMVTSLFNAICKKLNKKPKNIEECCKQTEFIQTKLEKLYSDINGNIRTMNEYYQLLDDLLVLQQNSQMQMRWKIVEYPAELKKIAAKSELVIENQRNIFKTEQTSEQDQLLKNTDTIQRQVTSFQHQFTRLEDYDDAFKQAQVLNQQLKIQQDKAALFNKREQLLGLDKTDYSQLEQLIKDFEPQNLLWTCVNKFNKIEQEVLYEDFKKIVANQIIEDVDQCFRDVSKCIRNLKETQQQVRDLAEQMKIRINQFKRNNDLLLALRNPAMRRRHWIQLGKLIDKDFRQLRYINGVETKHYGQDKTDEDSDIDYVQVNQQEPQKIQELNSMPVNYTFNQALSRDGLNQEKILQHIKTVSSQASSQFMIEKTIDELETNWSGVKFTLMEYQSSGVYILKQLDEIIQQLDDSITMIQSMSFAPFKDYFIKSIQKWELSLTSSSEIIEVWVQVQQSWLYLEPIFASADIARQLPTESKLFRQVDSNWRQHMNLTFKNPLVINICTQTKDLLKNLTKYRDDLEKVQKGLADYLETKRIAFPRFFFLSDEELLQILSNTKNPQAVQPFLRSCFENVARIKFVGDNYQMVSMTSHEGEVVQFVDPLVPTGQVENWMTQLEKLVIKTVKHEVINTLCKYVDMTTQGGVRGRANWVRSGFAQGIILVNQMAFCNDTEHAINGGYLKKYQQQLDIQLNCMTDMVREGLNKLESKCFSALLTYDVFQRDQVSELIDAKVQAITDFDWLKHPKHFCNADELYLQPIHGHKDNYYSGRLDSEEYLQRTKLVIQKAQQIDRDQFIVSFNQILSTLPYTFEYLGNTPRLVITPLTLKIYSTIAQSQSMYKFTSAAGPAGSGKTETSKQMTNKEFGLVCVVFNCSEGLDLIGIKRMLSGVISSGGCLVMDEINRLSLDVLSVFAQMVLGVQRGLNSCGGSQVKPSPNKYGKSQAHIQITKHVFESAELNLQSSATVIITMNPNYSGRQKLPANLVALFRSVSVMVPNYMKICQIRLYSFGFKKASALAQKAVSVFKLCSEQLSQCSWYDYGMRAINSTIQAAGNIRQELGNMCVQDAKDIPLVELNGNLVQNPKWYLEEQIVLRAITEVNLPKFLENDALLFGNILKDLFPGIKQPYIDYNILRNELKVVLRSNQSQYLQPEDAYVDKIIDLYMTINLRHGLMTLGNACAGKSEAIYGLKNTLNRLNEAETQVRLQKFKDILKANPLEPLANVAQSISEDYTWQRMAITRLNPKSITMDQLFGQFDPLTKEWHDGILSTCVRNAVADYNKHLAWAEQNLYNKSYKQGTEATVSDVNPEVYIQKANYTRQIVLHDGYIDSLWIESLNTVLDDSKRLCLTSGEIICLTPVMNMLFNMDSVAEASPATISRNGMLYFTSLGISSVGGDEKNIGQLNITGNLTPQAYIQTWIDRLPDQLRLDDYKPPEGAVSIKSEFKSKHGQNEKLSVMALVFKELLNQFIIDAIAYVNANCDKYQDVMDSALILNMFRLLDTFLRELKPNDFGQIEQWQIDSFRHYQEAIFFFCLVWSVGAILSNDESRYKFDSWLRRRMNELTYLHDNPIPDQINGKRATIFDFQLKMDSYEVIKEKQLQSNDYVVNLAWVQWGEAELEKINFDSLMGITDAASMQRPNLADIIVPTPSNIQQQYLIRRLLTNGYPTLIVGPTGSGKTAVIKDYLQNNKIDAKTQIPLLMTFSANTQAGQVQEFMDSKLEKRRRGVYGPPASKKYIFYIDDLNLPMKERYGCINSHELVRQLIAHEGWFDLKELTFKSIIETTVVASMVQAGGSRNPVTQRLLRHFNVIDFLDMNEQQLKNIFGQIVEWWSNKQFDFNIVKDMNPKLVSACKKLVDMGVSIYDRVRSGLLPTPSKEHYTYNLRDLSKLFQGFMMVEPKNIYFDAQKSIQQNQQVFYEQSECIGNLLKVFIHENQRVFGDRLINQTDQKWLLNTIDEQMQKHISLRMKDIFGDKDPSELLYGDFLAPSANKTAYQQINDYSALSTKLQQTLNACNDEIGGMNLVLFKMAIQHLARIVRILRQDNSNMLLIGVGGVGRQSLTKLAAFHLGYKVSSIKISKNYGIPEWRKDIKDILLESGLQMIPQVFMLADQHIFSDKQLEDISILLNTCDLQTIYEQDDMMRIQDNENTKELCRRKELAPTKQNLYDCYLKNVKANIHIVLCFSPSGASLRTRLRKFPSLVNCCSIDYVSNWPREAMLSVGRQIYGFGASKDLQDFDQQQMEQFQACLTDQCKINAWDKKQTEENIIQYLVDVHESVEKISVQYKDEQGRFNHVTPTLYLNALKQLYEILMDVYQKSNSYKQQLTQGLETLKTTQEKVSSLQTELTQRQPELVKISASVDAMMIQLEKDKKEAENTRITVQKEKQISAQKFQECDAIKQDADRELSQVQPLLDQAVEVLNNLKQSDFQEIANYKQPPQAIVMVLESICILMRMKPNKVADKEKAGAFVEDYWDSAKKLLTNSQQLMNDLLNYQKEQITLEMVNKLKKYINEPFFNQKDMEKKSKAASGLCAFVNAMFKFYYVNQNVIPKRQKQAEAQTELDIVDRQLKETEARLDEANRRIVELQTKFDDTLNEKERLAFEVEDCSKRLDRAQSLMVSLGGEQSRWTQQLADVTQGMKNTLAKSLFATACVIYQGAFNSEFRKRLTSEWTAILQKHQLSFGEQQFQLTDILSDQVTLINYINTFKLPSDVHSQQNAVLLFSSKKYCLLIDPEQQGQQFLRNVYKEQGLDIIKANDPELSRTLQNSFRFGKVLLITGVENEIDPSLTSIIEQKYEKDKTSGNIGLNFDGNFVQLNKKFRLILCSHLNNPNYQPEQFVRMTVVNFAITQAGLQDQLLGHLFIREQREQEELKNQLVVQNSKMMVERKSKEQEVLSLLGNNNSDILSNEPLIETLSQLQKNSKEIEEKMKESEITEANIDTIRKEYVPMARRGAILYFCVQDLMRIDFMYQYSLNWYINLYNQSIDQTEPATDRAERLDKLIDHFTLFLYQTVCRSLFDEHKQLFSLLIAIRIAQQQNKISPSELKFLMVHPANPTEKQNPCPQWLSEKAFQQLVELEHVCPVYKSITESLKDLQYQAVWRALFESDKPEDMPFPSIYSQVTAFQRFLPLCCIRPDRVIAYSRIFVAAELGSEYIQPQIFNIATSYKDSTNLQPILFVLNDMADPISDLMQFAEAQRMNKRTQVLSLGRGVEKPAINLITQYAEKGGWCVLQNCHLCVRFLKMLEQTLEQLNQDPNAVNKEFRLWLTAQPTTEIPVPILQNSVKIAVENPNDLKSNLMRVWLNNITQQQFDNAVTNESNVSKYKKLTYSLSVFYAVLLQRKKYGPIGFNTPYAWSAADVAICIQQLPIFLDRYLNEYPKDALNYLFAQINIGGCVTDATDQRTVNAIVEDFLDARVMHEGWMFQSQKHKTDEDTIEMYQFVGDLSYEQYIETISKQIPIECHPNNLGLNLNSNITADRNECDKLLDSLQLMNSGSKAAAKTAGANQDQKLIEQFQQQIPKDFDLEAIALKYPTVFEESLNSLLAQECGRFNILLQTMRTSAAELIKALLGQTIMSEELEKILQFIQLNKLPEEFAKYSYPSLKPFNAYLVDLNLRVQFFTNWIKSGKPKIYSISSFFFAQGFLTSVMQNYARKYAVAIDTISFNFQITEGVLDDSAYVQQGCVLSDPLITPIKQNRPQFTDFGDATFISGLYLEAARLQETRMKLTEANPRELYYKMPVFKFTPVVQGSPDCQSAHDEGLYECPCYRTLARFGTLSTTGHSTNFLLMIYVPCEKGTARHWIKRSVALFASLSE